MRHWFISLMTLALASLAFAGDGGPKPKLPAPENVVCPVVDGLVEVSWDAVEDAFSYQVEYVGFSQATPVVQETVPVFGLSLDIELAPFGAVAARVRALPAPKHAGNPPQSANPKGDWSTVCLVVLEPTPL